MKLGCERRKRRKRVVTSPVESAHAEAICDATSSYFTLISTVIAHTRSEQRLVTVCNTLGFPVRSHVAVVCPSQGEESIEGGQV